MSQSPYNAKHEPLGSFTPGPWRVTDIFRDIAPNIIGVLAPRSAISGFNGFCVAHVQRSRDAALIAAAPELLEEAKRNLEWMESVQKHSQFLTSAATVTRAILQKRIDATRAAIAKAEGSANV